VKVDGNIGDVSAAAETAADLESIGFDAATAAEVNQDPFLPLVLAADTTSTIELSTSIAVAFARSPMTLAYTAHDLQRFSGGRFTLGLGAQVKAHIARRFSMPWGRPAPQMREFVLAMRAAWACWSEGAPLDFEGEYYSHTLMTPTFVPNPHSFGAPKLALAGVGTGMTRVAGEVADGFLCHGFTTTKWIRERTIPALAEGRALAGRTLEGFDITAHVFLATGSDEAMAAGLSTIRKQIAFYGSTPAYRPVLDLHGWGDLGVELTALSKQNRWDDMAKLIDDDVVDAFSIVAPASQVPARIAERFEGVATRIGLGAQSGLSRDELAEMVAAVQAIPAGISRTVAGAEGAE